MSDNKYCYFCQEPKTVVGHVSQSCPNVKCKKCGEKGHVLKNCPNLNLNMNQKLQANIPAFMDADVPDSKRVKTEENSEEKEAFSSLETMDLIHAIEFSDDIKPKLEIKEEPIDVKGRFEHIEPKLEVNDNMLKARSSKMDQRHDLVDPLAPKDKEMVNFVHDIEFSDDTKPKLEIKGEPLDVKSRFELIEPKLEVKEEMLKAKSSGMNKRCDDVDPILPKDKEMINIFHDIEFSDDIKPKLEIKEEPIDVKSRFEHIEPKLDVKDNMLKAKSYETDQRPDIVDPMAPKDKEMVNFFHDIEFSDDIKPKLEIKEEPIDTKSSSDSINTKYAQDAKEDATGNAPEDAPTETLNAPMASSLYASADPRKYAPLDAAKGQLISE